MMSRIMKMERFYELYELKEPGIATSKEDGTKYLVEFDNGLAYVASRRVDFIW